MTNERTFIFIIGFVLFFLGWLNIITGFVIMINAEDTIFLGLGLESMVFSVFEVTKQDQMFQGFLRVAIGFFIILIANSLIAERHAMFRPSLRDCQLCLDKLRR